MKIFDILPQGEENAIPGSEIDHLLGITPRERRAQASRELAQGLMTLYTSEPPGGYFRPSDGEKGRAEGDACHAFCSHTVSVISSVLKK